MGDFTKYHPWRAPGHSKTVDPCGMGGAYLAPQSEQIAPEGSKAFARGSELPVGVRTEWSAGDVVEVGWMLGSNHGGGYLYSLCPTGEALTEECFQMRTLPFVGSHHTIRYLDNRTEFTIPAVDVSEGTWPKGSVWRKNPIPACNCDRGDSCLGSNATIDIQKSYADAGPPQPKGEAGAGNDCPTGTQFPVPFPYGYGMHMWYNKEDGPSRDMWAIVDLVQVPKTTGDFVLRWRWVRGLVRLCLVLARIFSDLYPSICAVSTQTPGYGAEPPDLDPLRRCEYRQQHCCLSNIVSPTTLATLGSTGCLVKSLPTQPERCNRGYQGV
jgi:hypothetical protein